MPIDILMPALSPTMEEGTLAKWHVKVGDPIKIDATIVEISTDKVDAEVPSPTAGTLVRMHAAEGDTVAVGALLVLGVRWLNRPATVDGTRVVLVADVAWSRSTHALALASSSLTRQTETMSAPEPPYSGAV